jgi:hypothetical protein
MTAKLCPCGSTPTLTEREQHDIQIMRLECACGRHGATLMYTMPEDRARMQQSAWDGWNLSL